LDHLEGHRLYRVDRLALDHLEGHRLYRLDRLALDHLEGRHHHREDPNVRDLLFQDLKGRHHHRVGLRLYRVDRPLLALMGHLWLR
jgi:hypothetical protein